MKRWMFFFSIIVMLFSCTKEVQEEKEEVFKDERLEKALQSGVWSGPFLGKYENQYPNGNVEAEFDKKYFYLWISDVNGNKNYIDKYPYTYYEQGDKIIIEIDYGNIVYYVKKNTSEYEVLWKYVEDNEIGKIMLVKNKKKKVLN